MKSTATFFFSLPIAYLIMLFGADSKPIPVKQISFTSIDCAAQAAKLPYSCTYDLTDTVSAHYPFQTIHTTGWLYYYKTNRDTVFEWKDVAYNAEESCDPGDLCLDSVQQIKYKVTYPDYPYDSCTTLPPVVIFFPPEDSAIVIVLKMQTILLK